MPGHHSTKYIFFVTPSIQPIGKRFIGANIFAILISISIGTVLVHVSFSICIQAFFVSHDFSSLLHILSILYVQENILPHLLFILSKLSLTL